MQLHGLKKDTRGLVGYDSDSSEAEDSFKKTPSTQDYDRTPSERHAFLFRNSLSGPVADLREYHPLPSQVPFLLDTYSLNVNVIIQAVHMPTIRKMIRSLPNNDASGLSPANEALMFAIYYASITSMEDNEVRAPTS